MKNKKFNFFIQINFPETDGWKFYCLFCSFKFNKNELCGANGWAYLYYVLNLKEWERGENYLKGNWFEKNGKFFILHISFCN